MSDDIERLKETNGKLCERINRQYKRIETLENLLQLWLDVDCNNCPWSGNWHDKLCKYYDRHKQQCELIETTKFQLAQRHND